MSFWQKFSNSKEDKQSSLEKKLKERFSSFSEERLIKLASISGLLAAVAFADLVVEDEEAKAIQKALGEWSTLSDEDCTSVSTIAQNYAKELVDLENHLYTNSLNELLSRDEKYYLIESLFEVAASDGNISGVEAEQIRSISKLLQLSSNLFLAARAKFSDKLGALKN